MTVPGRRAERLADRIRAEVAEMVSAELKDPRIGFATVVPDLKSVSGKRR
jgi:ribosome-binding factor A